MSAAGSGKRPNSAAAAAEAPRPKRAMAAVGNRLFLLPMDVLGVVADYLRADCTYWPLVLCAALRLARLSGAPGAPIYNAFDDRQHIAACCQADEAVGHEKSHIGGWPAASIKNHWPATLLTDPQSLPRLPSDDVCRWCMSVSGDKLSAVAADWVQIRGRWTAFDAAGRPVLAHLACSCRRAGVALGVGPSFECWPHYDIVRSQTLLDAAATAEASPFEWAFISMPSGGDPNTVLAQLSRFELDGGRLDDVLPIFAGPRLAGVGGPVDEAWAIKRLARPRAVGAVLRELDAAAVYAARVVAAARDDWPRRLHLLVAADATDGLRWEWDRAPEPVSMWRLLDGGGVRPSDLLGETVRRGLLDGWQQRGVGPAYVALLALIFLRTGRTAAACAPLATADWFADLIAFASYRRVRGSDSTSLVMLEAMGIYNRVRQGADGGGSWWKPVLDEAPVAFDYDRAFAAMQPRTGQ